MVWSPVFVDSASWVLASSEESTGGVKPAAGTRWLSISQRRDDVSVGVDGGVSHHWKLCLLFRLRCGRQGPTFQYGFISSFG
ncbi:unnamed protein product [Brassica napus]|uniref:(rape) hypothetical protein n=1 Tax=Brassica napus TaxID=3708 RepID=A0A817B920_BRANA|nr:unnamed protein product [Brassica napus]